MIFSIVFRVIGLMLFSSVPDGEVKANFVEYSLRIPSSEVYIDMVPVSGGTFTMFDTEETGGARSSFEVKVDSFWMSRHEISWQQYELFVNEFETMLANKLLGLDKLKELGIDPDAVSVPSQPYLDITHGMPTDGFPAVSMTHYAAVGYAKWLSAQTGDFYRLPTEAEWEYACRAGSDGERYEMSASESRQTYGQAADKKVLLDEHEWFEHNTEHRYGPVAEKRANGFGLKDMMGNVAEWTMDQYMEGYYKAVKEGNRINPWFYPDELYPRALRGGTWRDPLDDIKCTTRRGSDPDWSRSDPQLPRSSWWHSDAPFVGIRLVRPYKTPPPEILEKYWIDDIPDF